MEQRSIGSIQVVSPAPRDIWSELLISDPNSMIYQSPAWTDRMDTTGQYADASRLYQAVDGRLWTLPRVRRLSIPPELASHGSFPSNWGFNAGPVTFIEYSVAHFPVAEMILIHSELAK